jgi:hypothetical protein
MNSPLLQAIRYSEKDYLLRGRYKDTSLFKILNTDLGEKAIQESENEQFLNPLTHGSYKALILHPKWKLRRKEILERDRYCCANCEGKMELQVHHRQYHFIQALGQFKAPWEYSDRLLITLCSKCHSQGHSKFKVPIIKL